MDSNNDKLKNIASMHQCHMAARNLFTKKVREISGKKSGEWTISKKKSKTF